MTYMTHWLKSYARLKFGPNQDTDFKPRSTSASRPDLLECCVQCSGEMLQVAQGDGVVRSHERGEFRVKYYIYIYMVKWKQKIAQSFKQLIGRPGHLLQSLNSGVADACVGCCRCVRLFLQRFHSRFRISNLCYQSTHSGFLRFGIL